MTPIHHSINLDDQISLNLSELYDFIIWKNNFHTILLLKFNNWPDKGKVYPADSLVKAYKTLSNIKINYLNEDSPALKQAQDKYAKSIIEQDQEVSSQIKKYFQKIDYKLC